MLSKDDPVEVPGEEICGQMDEDRALKDQKVEDDLMTSQTDNSHRSNSGIFIIYPGFLKILGAFTPNLH